MTAQLDLPTVPHDSSDRPPAATPFHLQSLHAPLGVLVQGLDARGPLAPAQVLALKQALRDRHVLVLRGQTLDDEQFLRLASYFGSVFQPPADVPVLGSDPQGGNTPDIVKVANVDDGVLGHGELSAHADHHWTPLPSAGSLLYALEVPASGGNTTWIDLAAAHDALDATTRERIAGLQLITYNPFLRRLHPLPSGQIPRYRTPDIEAVTPFVAHPLVRTHPDSGRRVLFLDAETEVELVGVDPAAGAALVARLRAHLLQPRFAYTHQWHVGDIVYWDNQATLHSRTPFDPSQRRVLKRISLAGSRPF
jgi:taurine dioxygenase